MIEFCTKKRMAVAICLLIVLSIIVLVIENELSSRTKNRSMIKQEAIKTVCKTGETRKIDPTCKKCSEFEKKSIEQCSKTGYVEGVQCITDSNSTTETKSVWQSCPKLPVEEEKHFWLFDGSIIAIGIISYVVVHIRENKLNRLLLEKVKRQLEDHV